MLADPTEEIRTYLKRKGMEYQPFVDEERQERMTRITYRKVSQ